MELSPSDKGRIEHQFDSFCKLVLVCEMKDYKKMILRKMAKEDFIFGAYTYLWL